MINVGRATWLRLPSGWKHFESTDSMTEDELQVRETSIAAINGYKYQ
jgi:hypothetical protein